MTRCHAVEGIAVTWDPAASSCQFMCHTKSAACDHDCGSACTDAVALGDPDQARCFNAVDSRDKLSTCFVKETACVVKYASEWVPHADFEVMLINEPMGYVCGCDLTFFLTSVRVLSIRVGGLR